MIIELLQKPQIMNHFVRDNISDTSKDNAMLQEWPVSTLIILLEALSKRSLKWQIRPRQSPN